MFFAGLGIIFLVWFVGSLARGKRLSDFRHAELLGVMFLLFVGAFGVGLLANPAAPGVWGFTLFGYVLVGLTAALLLSIGMPTRREDRAPQANKSSAAVHEVYAKRYQTAFVGLTVATMIVAVLTRFLFS